MLQKISCVLHLIPSGQERPDIPAHSSERGTAGFSFCELPFPAVDKENQLLTWISISRFKYCARQ